MPANLTPQYHLAEAEYRRATTPEEALRGLEAMLREVPKHKGTDKLQADLKQRISRLRGEIERRRQAPKSSGPGLRLPRQGAGRTVVIGPPNSGKSRLLAALTRAAPEVAPYPFTTREPSVGMMAWEDVFVQLVDTPAIGLDDAESTVFELVRGADSAVLLFDLGDDDGAEAAAAVLRRFAAAKTRLGSLTGPDPTEVGTTTIRTLVALNKIDLPGAAERRELLEQVAPFDFPAYPISAERGDGLETLRAAVFQSLDVIRVYTKAPSRKEPDYERPFTIRRGGAVSDVAERVHEDVARNFKFARIWGAHVRPGTIVKGDYRPADRDVVELHTS